MIFPGLTDEEAETLGRDLFEHSPPDLDGPNAWTDVPDDAKLLWITAACTARNIWVKPLQDSLRSGDQYIEVFEKIAGKVKAFMAEDPRTALAAREVGAVERLAAAFEKIAETVAARLPSSPPT